MNRRAVLAGLAGAHLPLALAHGASRDAAGQAADRHALDAAAAATGRHRKRRVELRLRTRDGRGVPGVQAAIRQVSHAFAFGVNLTSLEASGGAPRAALERAIAQVFNLGIVPFYWGALETGSDGLDFSRQERLVGWAEAHGLMIKGHPLLWGQPGLGWPAHRSRLPGPEDRLAHVAAVLARFGDRVRLWDVVNEPVHFPEIGLSAAHRLARAMAPAAHLIVNEYGAMGDPRHRLFGVLQAAIAEGVPFDGIGLQAHEPKGRAYPLAEAAAVLDRYATLGKRLHLTELAFQSDLQPVGGSPWRGRWSEAAQADYVEAFYRVAFAHPAVDSITWWVTLDGADWRPGAELMRSDLSWKPVLKRLDRLVNDEWRTRFDAATDAAGNLGFEGFLGNYEIALAGAGSRHVVRATVGHGDAPILVAWPPAG